MIKQIISLFEKNKSVYLPLIYMSCTIMYKIGRTSKDILDFICAPFTKGSCGIMILFGHHKSIDEYSKDRGETRMSSDKTLEFMGIAMKYFPEAKAKLEASGIPFSMEMAEPFMELFKSVMQEAYELGKQDAQR